jgi:hypothetical protein
MEVLRLLSGRFKVHFHVQSEVARAAQRPIDQFMDIGRAALRDPLSQYRDADSYRELKFLLQPRAKRGVHPLTPE